MDGGRGGGGAGVERTHHSRGTRACAAGCCHLHGGGAGPRYQNATNRTAMFVWPCVCVRDKCGGRAQGQFCVCVYDPAIQRERENEASSFGEQRLSFELCVLSRSACG